MKRGERSPREQRVLVTAFEPFGGRSTNRSQLVLEHIARAAASPRGIRGGARVITRVLPVSFARLEASVDRALACKPDVVILLGEAGKADQLRIQRVAINRIHATVADNDGAQPQEEAVKPGGPAAYFSTVRPKSTLAAVRRSGAPAVLSHEGGSFAGNAAYYLALHRLHAAGQPVPPVTFVHVPVRSRSLALREATKGVLALLRHLVDETAPATQTGRRRPSPGGMRATPIGGRKA